MAQLTAETAQRIAREMYGYELSHRDADRMARVAGAMFTLSHHLADLDLAGLEPPFSYSVLAAEAEFLAKGRK